MHYAELCSKKYQIKAINLLYICIVIRNFKTFKYQYHPDNQLIKSF
jgi:hypothetical protein